MGYFEITGSGFDPLTGDRLVGLVVKASAPRAANPGFESRLCRGVVVVG